jgi:P-type Ca2+ transporter type 2C
VSTRNEEEPIDSASPPRQEAAARRTYTGLTASEAARRLCTEGPNALPGRRDQRVLRLVLGILAEPMFLLLCGAVGLYVVLGELREALVLGASLVAVVAITVLQEWRADRALAALRDLSSPRAAVVRDGELQRISGREVVRGDIVLLSEGDRVPADGLLRESTDLEIDESLLTGESMPAAKRADPDRAEMARPQADSLACVYSGSLVIRGHGTAEIMATGASTEVGRIGHVLAGPRPEGTPLYRETRRLVRWLAAFGGLLCLAVMLLYAGLRSDWVGGALAGITLAMAILPEEFPVVLTVFLALGAWRLSKHKVLTRSMPAIEALGSATVLAVDKTGTLTENRMAIAVLDDGARTVTLGAAGGDVDAALRELLGSALAACEIDAFDPMERAIVDAAKRHAPDRVRRLGEMSLVREYELTAQLPAVTHAWAPRRGGPLCVAAKGAPEAIAAICRLAPDAAGRLLERTERLARDGLRVLAVADGEFAGPEFPQSPHGFGLRLRGLLGLMDPVRASVPAALDECRMAGIRVIMITGDHAATARSIARAVGLDDASGTVTGAELAALDEAGLRETARAVNVYARTPPDEKLRLVQALRANGEIVAMTGDGVNDAPALKAAHIGIAMGGRGADVAREAAALVLLDDDFSALVAGVGAGRRIYENIRNAMSYLLAVHIPLAGIGLLPLLLGWPLLLFPLHVVFVEFVIDPACSLVFETEHRTRDAMRRPPRDPRQRMFSRSFVIESAALGVTSLLATLFVYGGALLFLPENVARALGFVTLVAGNLALILVNRSREDSLAALLRRPNPAFWWICSLAAAALALALAVPPVAEAFRFERPSLFAVAAAIVLGCGVVLVSGYLRGRRRPRGNP